jgi:hypothetical protein
LTGGFTALAPNPITLRAEEPLPLPGFPFALGRYARQFDNAPAVLRMLVFSPSNSLFGVKSSLIGWKKFPVPASREFACKRLNAVMNARFSFTKQARNAKISLYFPGYQGIARRDRFASHCLVSQSRIHRLLTSAGRHEPFVAQLSRQRSAGRELRGVQRILRGRPIGYGGPEKI